MLRAPFLRRISRLVWLILLALCLKPWGTQCARASEIADLVRESDDLRSQIEELRKQFDKAQPRASLAERTESILADKGVAGPQPVRTGQGALRIGGLFQVWAYSIQNDSIGLSDIGQVVVGPARSAARNEEADNDSFRVRRAEIRLELDIHENLRAYVMIDPARSATAFPSLPENQASNTSGDRGVFFFDPCLCAGFLDDPRHLGDGTGRANRLLQDAYLNVHGFIPHHDVSIGQMKRRLGREGFQDSGSLDFVERATVSRAGDLRDLGIQVHGSWIQDRVQYWIGLFNGAGTAFQDRANRADDNDAKDVLLGAQIFPVRGHEQWGTLELGFSLLAGTAGESGGHRPGTNAVDGLNRRQTARLIQQAWAHYAPAGPVRGWWMSGEWGRERDRLAPGEAETGLDVISFDPAPISIQGWYVSTGYDLRRSRFARNLPRGLNAVEFLFRYEVMQNVFFHDLVRPERRFDAFKTQVYTAGINYYLHGHNAKIQLNYNWVLEDDHKDKDDRQLREVRNDNIVLNFQVAF